jgi:hypothetical protein
MNIGMVNSLNYHYKKRSLLGSFFIRKLFILNNYFEAVVDNNFVGYKVAAS